LVIEADYRRRPSWPTIFAVALLIGLIAFLVAYIALSGVKGVGLFHLPGWTHPMRVRVWRAFVWAAGSVLACISLLAWLRGHDERRNLGAVAAALGLETYPPAGDALALRKEREQPDSVVAHPVPLALVTDPPPGGHVCHRQILTGSWRHRNFRLWVAAEGVEDNDPEYSCAATPFGQPTDSLVEFNRLMYWHGKPHAKQPHVGWVGPPSTGYEVRAADETYTAHPTLCNTLLAIGVPVTVRIGSGWLLIVARGGNLARPTLTGREHRKGKLDGIALGRLLLDTLTDIHATLTEIETRDAEAGKLPADADGIYR
jgi:hypothetical protein